MSQLFSSYMLRDLLLPNRIIVPPMCQYTAEKGNAVDWHLIHLGSLALSGAGLLIIESTAVSEQGRITKGCLGLWNDENERALAKVVKAVRQYSNIPIGIQLSHAGRKGSAISPFDGRGALSPAEGAWETVGPSPVAFAADWPAPRELDTAALKTIVTDFVAATRRADSIGLQMIELHCAHGYLLSQFLSPIANRRDDEYGGSRANRMRFPLEVFEAMRAVWPAHKPLGVRVNGTDWDPSGLQPEDAVEFATQLKALGCDYVDASSGGNAMVKAETGPGYQVPFATRIKQGAGIATMAVGMIKHPFQAEQIIVSGLADMVAVGRGTLNNPHWAWWAAETLHAVVKVPPQYARAATSEGLPPPSWTPPSQ